MFYWIQCTVTPSLSERKTVDVTSTTVTSPPPARVISRGLRLVATTTATAAQLELVAGEPSWLEVRQLNGKSLYVGELVGRQRFALGEGLQVLAGRPDLVRVQVGDAPARVLGSVETVEWQTFKPAER